MIARIVAAMTARLRVLEKEKNKSKKKDKVTGRITRRSVNSKKPLSIPKISKEIL